MRAVARGREFAGSKAAFPALAAARRAGRRSARESRVRGMTLGIRGGGHAHGGVCARQMAQSLGTNQTLLACASLAKVVVSLIV